MKHLRHVLFSTLLCVFAAPTYAAAPQDPKPAEQTPEAFVASLHPQHGTIKLPDGVATLTLPEDYYYLSPADADRLLTDGWGNPPGQNTQGMIIPKAVSPMSNEGWGVIITYRDDGHVADEDAAKIDYNDLLKQMQSDDEDANEDRKKQGYSALHLVGWAEPPHYDAQNHKMYWARELQVEGAKVNTLNYAIRVLGRKGVLELNAVAGMNQLPSIKPELDKVLAFTNFDEGNRYTDFVPSTDKLATYGLAALVAGGIAAKAGLFAKIGLLLLAFKKFVILGGVAVAAFVRKLFGRKPS